MVGERAADRDDEIGFLEVFDADLGRVAAGDADAERIVVEKTARGQRRHEQSADLGGECAAGRACAGFDRPEPCEHNHALGTGEELRSFDDVVRMRRHRRRTRQ